MYDGVLVKGRTLAEWVRALKGAYTPGELYRMVMEGGDIERLTHEVSGDLTER